jgi:hypothetical protein
MVDRVFRDAPGHFLPDLDEAIGKVFDGKFLPVIPKAGLDEPAHGIIVSVVYDHAWKGGDLVGGVKLGRRAEGFESKGGDISGVSKVNRPSQGTTSSPCTADWFDPKMLASLVAKGVALMPVDFDFPWNQRREVRKISSSGGSDAAAVSKGGGGQFESE